MDFHKIANVTIDDVKKAHLADEAIQDKYGVKYHQFWVNQDTGSVFCLVEGPDKETCERVHQMAHGNLACALTEVEIGFYEKLMGKEHKVQEGHVKNNDGSEDLGYRNILIASVYGKTRAHSLTDLSQLQRPHWARKIIMQNIAAYQGRELAWEKDDSLIGVFHNASHAIQCALQIQQELMHFQQKQPEIIFKIGISASQPVTEQGDFFKEAIKLAHRLSVTVQDNQILISSLVKKLCKTEELLADSSSLRSLNLKEEEFVSNLISIAEAKLADQQFDLNRLSNEVCVSRPQLYRKVMSLTGRSPIDFIRDLRMDKALALLKQKRSNIAEIAYESGFNSSSYFTKCFTDKFGCTPSLFMKTDIA
jgi:AraC-like DNA-binding protein